MDLNGEAGCGFSSCSSISSAASYVGYVTVCFIVFRCFLLFAETSLREVGRLAIRKASAGREACAAGFVGHCTADFGMPSALRGGWRR